MQSKFATKKIKNVFQLLGDDFVPQTPYRGSLPQSRLIQWARWARARGPQASGGPQTADALIFSSREISIKTVYFSLAK